MITGPKKRRNDSIALFKETFVISEEDFGYID